MKSVKGLLVAALLLVTAACGGGGGGSTPPSNTVAGVAAAGIIKGGTVKVFAPYSSVTGADKRQIGATATTDAVTGAYTVNLGAYTGPVIVEVTGGTYTDEATGNANATIPAGAPLRAVAVSSAGSVNVAVTPLTELAARQATVLAGAGNKLTAAEINQANSQISDLFKVSDIVAVQPLDAGAPLTGTQAQKDYTLALAAISQLANNAAQLAVTLDTVAAGISTAGVMDPAVAGNISTALTTFVTTNTNNQTGVTTVPETLGDLGTTTVTLTLVLSGTGVKGVETDITLPANVSVATEPSGATLEGVLTNLVGGTTVELRGSSVNPGSMHVIFLRTDATASSMPAGDIMTVKVLVAPGVAAPAVSAFTLASTKFFGTGGALLSGPTLTLR